MYNKVTLNLKRGVLYLDMVVFLSEQVTIFFLFCYIERKITIGSYQFFNETKYKVLDKCHMEKVFFNFEIPRSLKLSS